MAKTVNIVHCIDTEGPLYESTSATFERLSEIFDIQLEPSAETLQKLQKGLIDLGGIEDAVKKVVDPHLLTYNDTWDKVDKMLVDAMSAQYRNRVLDSYGNGWIYNWFCVDHVDYEVNPRRRDIGYHNIFDHYRDIIQTTKSPQDSIHFHFHPQPFRREGHRCATHFWANSNSLGQVLSRRIIDRNWFPVAHRPGFHVIRPDSHWFLEQFIPFSPSSLSKPQTTEDKSQFGLESGRYGDWRRAPITWVPYHPSHDDYQVPGNCRRWITRCLNIGTRYLLLEESDIRLAFEEAQLGKPVILAITNHDFRDLRDDIDEFRNSIAKIAADYPDVKYRYSEVVDAMRSALKLSYLPPCEFEFEIHPLKKDTSVLSLYCKTPTFGPQPWLAIKTSAGTYHYDNLDTDIPFHQWKYVFDRDTYPLNALSKIGFAANNAYGTTTIVTYDPSKRHTSKTILND